jgi:hypothetical protein
VTCQANFEVSNSGLNPCPAISQLHVLRQVISLQEPLCPLWSKVDNNSDSCTVGRVWWVLKAHGRQVPSKEIMWAFLPSLAFMFFFLLFHLLSQLPSARRSWCSAPFLGRVRAKQS